MRAVLQKMQFLEINDILTCGMFFPILFARKLLGNLIKI